MTEDTFPAPPEGLEAAGEPWILVTNDDGADTPALPPLIEALEALARVRTVVPDREYSWSSKTLSRFRRLRLKPPAGAAGPPLHTLDGSPADCANVGIHNLAERAPGLVVSGINIGANAGLAFLLSSGTVGAAIEGALSGVPAVAISLQLRAADYARWRAHRDAGLPASAWTQAAAVAREICAEVRRGGLPQGADLLSVNLPPGVAPDTPRVLTGVARTGYGPFFRRAGDGCLEHEYAGLRRAAGDVEADLEILERGHVAITPLRLQLDVPATAADRRRFGTGSPC